MKSKSKQNKREKAAWLGLFLLGTILDGIAFMAITAQYRWFFFVCALMGIVMAIYHADSLLPKRWGGTKQ
jgi:hypothetical protein